MYISSNSHRWNLDSWIFLLFVYYGGNNLLDSVYKHVVWAISFSVDLLSLCKQWRYCVPCGADLMSLYKLCCFMGQRWNARKWLDWSVIASFVARQYQSFIQRLLDRRAERHQQIHLIIRCLTNWIICIDLLSILPGNAMVTLPPTWPCSAH